MKHLFLLLFLLPTLTLAQRQVTWETLAKVESKWQNNRYVTEFKREVLALDGRQIRIQGFMIPLEMSEQHQHFFVAARPAHCYFEAPGGKEMIEIYANRNVDFSYTPVTVVGTLQVLRNDRFGLYYRIRNAQVTD